MDVLDLYGTCWLMGKMKHASSLREDGHFTGNKDDNRLVSVSISRVQRKSDPVARIKWLIIRFPAVSCYI